MVSHAPKSIGLMLGLCALAAGCTTVPVDPGMDLEPGIKLPTSDGSDDDGLPTDGDTDGDTDPDREDGGTSGGDTDPDGDDSSGEPADDDGPPTCADETIQLEVEPPQVMLLLDKSGSMVQHQWDHDDDPETPQITRWNSLHNVVDELTHSVEDGIELGMTLFPSASLTETNSATACTVDPEPAAVVSIGNADAIVEALPEALSMQIHGGTPVSSGFSVVLDHLDSIEDGRPQAVVLVTDGAANCMAGTSGDDVFTQYDEGLAPMISEAAAAGIPTYVIGVDILDEVGIYPVDNPYVRLNELAMAGGVPQEGSPDAFYNTTDEQALLDALDGITAELSCVIDLSIPADYADQVTITAGTEEIPRVEQCSEDGVGWRFAEEAAPYSTVELCTSSCGLVHAEATLDVEYTCLPQG